MKHTIFCDIDGTIYNHKLELHKDTLAHIHHAQALGVEFVIATGNGLFDQVRKVAQMTNARYAITSNGAAIFDFTKQTFILQEVIPAKIANELLQYALKHQIRGNWWDQDNVYVTPNQSEKIINIINKILNPQNGVIKAESIEAPIFKIEFYDEPDKIDLIEEEVMGLGLQVARIKPTHVEITHVNISKGSAVKFMQNKLQVLPENTMSVGDSSNDLPMFRVTGHSYAMANGKPHVHEIANHHTAAVEQNGLGLAIIDFIYRMKLK